MPFSLGIKQSGCLGPVTLSPRSQNIFSCKKSKNQHFLKTFSPLECIIQGTLKLEITSEIAEDLSVCQQSSKKIHNAKGHTNTYK